MRHYEQDNTQETIGQQFIDYVVSHSDPVTKIAEVTREGKWRLDVKLPLMGDAVKGVSFVERRMIDGDYRFTDERGYDIIVDTHKGLNVLFAYEPSNLDNPYCYNGHENTGSGSISEQDIADLMSELKAYEATGQMAKIQP